MASSNRHWPSMFKSKPHHQWQPDLNSSLLTTACHRSPHPSVCEERSPDPKPRWNPKPEQIRILEAIFNSGMVNPPRDEIRKIRAQLQEYGQVGDANVFYWFQNRKSRSKHKQRHLQTTKPNNSNEAATASSLPAVASTLPSSVGLTTIADDVSNSPAGSLNQPYFLFQEPTFCFTPPPPTPPPTSPVATTAICSPELLSNPPHPFPDHGGLLISDVMIMNHGRPRKLLDDDDDDDQDVQKMIKLHQHLNYTVSSLAPPLFPSATTAAVAHPVSASVSSPIHNIQGGTESGDVGPAKSTVFINDVAFELSVGPFNVKEAFGYDAVLVHSSGQPVLTNEWGVTVQSLQHGAFYYLVRTLSPQHGHTIDLV